ncbi:primase alpha helix C-terminal domain-containing protein [Streptococcus pluranimalium]|uniref:primase alpha helix C-terminal domain-containing protein n=1 Tax=Streptococcus pluranimalium TaxID=82348 RepID=UPI003F68CFD7
MAIYESRGFGNTLHLFDKIEPFDYIARFKPLTVPRGMDIEEYKRTQAPYCISGKVTSNGNGIYKRNNTSLIYRDLIFLDYDEIETGVDFPKIVSEALSAFSYIIYPTIKHTAEKQRFRLVVKPSHKMKESTYKRAVAEIAEKIGLPYDTASLTWSQLQGLPVSTGNPDDYQRYVNRGLDYPIKSVAPPQETKNHSVQLTRHRSMTMRVVDTLLHGFGDEGGRNVSLTHFVGVLLNRRVDCDIPTAWELTKIANSVTDNPLSSEELERTFESIVKREIRKRGLGLSN